MKIQRRYHLRQAFSVILMAVGAACLIAEPAHAYVDPGTGSFLLQLLFAFFFGVAFTFRRSWRALLRSFGRTTADDRSKEKPSDDSR